MDDEDMRPTPYEQRLDRMEAKLDGISEAIATFARVEERQIAAAQRLDRLEVKMDETEKALDIVRLQQISSSQSVKTGERIAWAFMTAITTGVGIWVVELIKR